MEELILIIINWLLKLVQIFWFLAPTVFKNNNGNIKKNIELLKSN